MADTLLKIMAGASLIWKSGAKVVVLFGLVVGIFPTFVDGG